MVKDSTAVGGVADATGDRQGPKEKDSTAVGGVADATGDRKGPIPSIVIFQKEKTHQGVFSFWSGRRESDPHGQLGKLKFYH